MSDKEDFEHTVVRALARIEERTSAIPEMKIKIDQAHDLGLLNKEKHKTLEKRIDVSRTWMMGSIGWLLTITGLLIELLIR